MKPDKILAKKFVRGKPYYKIKWDGLPKDQSTWQTPPTLQKYRKMINDYEMKNWGVTLSEQFFDPTIYLNKGFPHRSKLLCKKKIEKKRTKKRQKKFQEMYSSESENSQNEQKVCPSINLNSQSSIQQNDEKDEGITKKNANNEKQRVRNAKKVNQTDKKNLKNQVLLIESSEDQRQMQISNQTSSRKERLLVTKNNPKQKIPEVFIEPIQQYSFQNEDCSSEQDAEIQILQKQRDYGLMLPSCEETQHTEQKKRFRYEKTYHLQIEARKIQQKVCRIYHLQKISVQNHLYLVQYENKEMKKLTSTELMQWHHRQFIMYLEGILRKNLRS